MYYKIVASVKKSIKNAFEVIYITAELVVYNAGGDRVVSASLT